MAYLVARHDDVAYRFRTKKDLTDHWAFQFEKGMLMPLYVEKVEAGTTPSGEPTIWCIHCHKPADRSETVSDGNMSAFELMCPGGQFTLGTWPNEQQRSADIRAFLDRTPRRQL